MSDVQLVLSEETARDLARDLKELDTLRPGSVGVLADLIRLLRLHTPLR